MDAGKRSPIGYERPYLFRADVNKQNLFLSPENTP